MNNSVSSNGLKVTSRYASNVNEMQLVFRRQEKEMGWVGYNIYGDECKLNIVSVREKERRKGYGTEFVNHLEKELRKQNIRIIRGMMGYVEEYPTVEIWKETLTHFYTKNGYLVEEDRVEKYL